MFLKDLKCRNREECSLEKENGWCASTMPLEAKEKFKMDAQCVEWTRLFSYYLIHIQTGLVSSSAGIIQEIVNINFK